jgi:drug/metabolite transporter (DMT)-like permease
LGLPAIFAILYKLLLRKNFADTDKNIFAGIMLAILATLIWSGNFIIARGVYNQIPPVSLAFYRWLSATVILLPFGYRSFIREKGLFVSSWRYFVWTALTGVSIFNTLVYIAGHSTTAINMALIGTTSSPVFAIVLAYIFLKERIGIYKVLGLFLCLAGILFLLSQASWQRLLGFRFSTGDTWMLLAGLTFAVYSVMVRKKPAGMSPVTFLLIVFTIGTFFLLPFYLYETLTTVPVHWTYRLLFAVLFLGMGASVISFYCWNRAIGKLGAARTSLFGNLIPIFSSLEAALFLCERFTWVHAVSMILVFAGLLLANIKSAKLTA